MDLSDSKNKIVRSVTPEQLMAFLEALYNTPGVDGPMIQALAMTKLGVKIGHESANNFRKEVYAKYILRLQKRKQLSEMVAANRDAGAGRTLADAASEELQQQVFEFLTDNDALNLADDEGMKRAEALARIIKSARSEDRRLLDQLNDRVKELEAERKQTSAAVLAAAKDKGGSPQLIESVRAAMNFRPPQSTTTPPQASAA